MKTWQKAGLMTLVTLAIGGAYLLYVFESRRNPGVLPQTSPDQSLTPDDVAIVRMKFMTTFDDALKLQGTSVWMKNGYTMPYFPYQSGHIVFLKRAGLIPSAQQLDVKKVIKAVPPDEVDDGISHGTRQVFAVFSLPRSPNLYATVIGAIDGGQEEYFSDVLFYYDDPHSIYDNWPKNVWAAIDAHQVIPGMNELQTRMSIGQDQHVESAGEGTRTITYNQAGKKWTITFVDNKATTINSP
ncbi:MAG TPA: hypothetical protein VMD76_11725 [Candidatus Sulfotelmatobacter sp.]|nr:hypothetical protein [Candidatus Sulfotelmatobacter sp.]